MEYPLFFSVHFKFSLMFRVVLDEKSKGEASAAGTPRASAQHLGF